jgi:hypothetical protein
MTAKPSPAQPSPNQPVLCRAQSSNSGRSHEPLVAAFPALTSSSSLPLLAPVLSCPASHYFLLPNQLVFLSPGWPIH